MYILRGKIRRTYIYTKGEDQMNTYIYILRGKIRRTYKYTKEEDQTDKYIYYRGRSDEHIYIY
jgi:hypothetical protein